MPTDSLPEIEPICCCGCVLSMHDEDGQCAYCFDCDGFLEDEDSTIVAYAACGPDPEAHDA